MVLGTKKVRGRRPNCWMLQSFHHEYELKRRAIRETYVPCCEGFSCVGDVRNVNWCRQDLSLWFFEEVARSCSCRTNLYWNGMMQPNAVNPSYPCKVRRSNSALVTGYESEKVLRAHRGKSVSQILYHTVYSEVFEVYGIFRKLSAPSLG